MKKHFLISMTIGTICLLMAMVSLWHTSEPQEEQPSQFTMVSVSNKQDYKNVSSDHERNTYDIDAVYDEKSQTVTGKLRIQVPNHQADHWQKMYFHLFPNAFKNWEFNKAAAPETEGNIEVSAVKVNGNPVKPKIEKTLMKLDLPNPLPKGKKAEVEMDFSVQLPKGAMRLNHVDNTAFLAQWYPMLAAYDEEGWHTDPYTTIGDPFYTDMADFTVTMDVPRGYRVISTADDSGNTPASSTVTLKQQNVRDFAVVVTKDYKAKSGKVGNTDVNVWYREQMDDVVDELFAAAKKGLGFFNEKFGTYPYPEIDIVLGETGHGIAGMEYPGLVTSLDRVSTRKGEEPAVNVVVHELAHQWWYGMVGSNQVKEPWLDEGLTTFSESLYMSEIEERPVKQLYKQAAVSSEQVHLKKELTVVDPVYDYPEQLYALMVYARPAAMLWDLSEKIGQEKVLKIMHEYFERYRYRTATTDDFIEVANDVSGEDLRPFFDKWLYFKE